MTVSGMNAAAGTLGGRVGRFGKMHLPAGAAAR